MWKKQCIFKKIVTIAILTAILVPMFTYLVMITKPSIKTPEEAERAVRLTFPFRKGDYLTLYRIVKLIDIPSNTTQIVENNTMLLEIVEPGWPFIKAKILVGNKSYPITIPTVELSMPLQLLGKNVSAPIHVSLLSDATCLPLEYRGITLDGETYVASTPETCKSLVVHAFYYSNGLVNKLSIFYSIGNTVYQEIYELVAWSTTGVTTTNVSIQDMKFCVGYYSENLSYTLPGAYLYYSGHVAVTYRFDKIVNETPLIIMTKSPKNEKLWRTLPLNYVGGVIIVSPLLRDFWRVPHLDEVEKYGAIMILSDGVIVYGAENITRYIAGYRP